MPTPEEAKQEIERLLRSNEKAQAIAYARTAFGVSWREARRLVEVVAKEHGIETAPAPKKAGCLAGVITLFAWFFLLGSLLLLGSAGITWYFSEEGIGNSELVVGEVVGLVPYNEYGDEPGGMAPVIAYTWQGEEREYEGRFYDDPPAYYIGEKVEIYVNREDPTDVTINSFTGRWLMLAIMAGAGGFLFMMAMAGFFLSRKMR